MVPHAAAPAIDHGWPAWRAMSMQSWHWPGPTAQRNRSRSPPYRRYPRQRGTRHGEPARRFQGPKPQRSDAFLAQNCAGMGRIVHGHGSPFSVTGLVIDTFDIRAFKSERYAPVAIAPHQPWSPLQITLEWRSMNAGRFICAGPAATSSKPNMFSSFWPCAASTLGDESRSKEQRNTLVMKPIIAG